MAKVSFTKVESVLGEALQKITIEHVKELGVIANLLHESRPKVSNQTIEQILNRFRNYLKKLKKHDRKLYEKLNISKKDEARFSLSIDQLTQQDWLKLKEIRESIETLKKELYGEEIFKKEDEERIKTERIKHVNKRFNIREGWLPLK